MRHRSAGGVLFRWHDCAAARTTRAILRRILDRTRCADAEGGYWLATSLAQGLAGLEHLIALRIAQGDNLIQLIDTWANSASDGNQPEAYIRDVLTWTGIPDAQAQLWDYLEPLTDPRKVVS